MGLFEGMVAGGLILMLLMKNKDEDTKIVLGILAVIYLLVGILWLVSLIGHFAHERLPGEKRYYHVDPYNGVYYEYPSYYFSD